ncbi:unnamed protein product [Cuscuta europaea]|uniref:Uncharacterized protein n=1 Tax=Cuscuta europaea TaxID=41803 RepID=A0A9P0YXM9_CUSEU|nr:unnamed protein product [Cuscuta europaea]
MHSFMDRAEAVAKTVSIIKVTDEGMMMASCPFCVEAFLSPLVHDLRMLLSAHLVMHPQDVELAWERIPNRERDKPGGFGATSFLFGVAATLALGVLTGRLFR